VITVETKARIRRDYYVHKKIIKQIVRDRQLSSNTVRKILRENETDSEYKRTVPSRSILNEHEGQLAG